MAASKGDSFRSVARRLALSPSAVSRRISGLESFLGITLFHRGGQSQRLTAAGSHYLSMVEPAMHAIQCASVSVAHGDPMRLKVAASHSFASAWLMPRLADLHRRHGIEVEVVPTRDCKAVRSGEADLGIWGGLSVPDDMIADVLVEAHVIPVASPRMPGGIPALDGDHIFPSLLSVRDPSGLWDRWFAACGETRQIGRAAREYATLQLMYEAAASGAGVALAMPLVAEPWLQAKKLLPCSARTLVLRETYSLYRPMRRLARTEIEQRFADWLREQIHGSMDKFAKLTETARKQSIAHRPHISTLPDRN